MNEDAEEEITPNANASRNNANERQREERKYECVWCTLKLV